jgi:hypothetical protein
MEHCVRIAGPPQYEVAVSLSRWTVIAVVSCLALAAAYLPPQPSALNDERSRSISREETRLNLVNRAWQRTEDLLGDLRLRDSLSAALRGRAARTADVDVVIRGALPEQARREFRVAVKLVWQRVHPTAGARLLVLLDARNRGYWPKYVLPAVLDGRTCAVSLTLDWNVRWLRNPGAIERGTSLQPWLLDAMGPCLYYAAFGQPGPHIAAWLEERSFQIANSADWNAAPRPVTLQDDPRMWEVLFSDMSFDALACTGGQVPRCRNAVEHTNNLETFRVRPNAARITGVTQRAFWSRNFAQDDHYLESLVHEMGRDRFARFWRSPAPVDSAFLSAFEQPIERWTAQWARAFALDLPPFGPAPRPVAVQFGLALVAIAVVGVSAYVMRRQVR